MESNCVCYICGKPIYRRPSRLNDHPCCSIGCRNKYFSGIRSFAWKNGASKNVDYMNKRQRVSEIKRRLEHKCRAVALFGGHCSKCGYGRSIAAMQFHHKNPEDKDYTIKDLMSGAWAKIEKELKKCVLVCSNCHFEIHEKERKHEQRKHEEAFRKVSKDFCAA